MRVHLAPALLCAFLTAPPLRAEPVSELSHLDLRRLLAAGQAEDPRAALAMARRTAGGEVLDIRAFAGKRVYYRVLMKNPQGRVVSLVIDAQSGVLEADTATITASVNAAASGGAQTEGTASADANAATGAGASASHGNAGGNAGNGGNGNAGGNGKGNAGGNGNGHGK